MAEVESSFMDPMISGEPATSLEQGVSRLGLRLVWAGYAAVAVISALLVYIRYLTYLANAQDAAAAGGMWAGGDLALEFIILFMFLAPTAALVFIIRKSEAAYTKYAKALLGISITAPLSMILMTLPFFNQWQAGDVLLFRLFAIPVVLFVLLCSLLLAGFKRARRIIVYALLVEGLSLVACFLGMFFMTRF